MTNELTVGNISEDRLHKNQIEPAQDQVIKEKRGQVS